MTEYGRIHTDGSRSGGQPVLLPCPVPWCNSLNVSSKVFEAKRKKHWLQCNDCGFSTPQMTSRAKAENIWGIRQPTQSDALREENERLREHLISALDTLKDAEICDDNCGPCNEAHAALEQSK